MKILCKLFKHYPSVYAYQEVGWSIPEPHWKCATCGKKFEYPESEEYAGIGIPLHKLISFIKDLKDRFDFKYRDIPF